MNKEHWIWMPHPAHFICADKCLFRLATVVGKNKEYIVSTIGEMESSAFTTTKRQWDTIGGGENDFYETYVFKAVKSDEPCCPYKIEVSKQVDGDRCATAKESTELHFKMCEKWDANVLEGEA